MKHFLAISWTPQTYKEFAYTSNVIHPDKHENFVNSKDKLISFI